jgi:hypothetical protein
MSTEPAPATPVLDREPPSPPSGTRDEVSPVTAPGSTTGPGSTRATAPAAGSGHLHTRSCYWDFRVAAWVCG